MPVKRLLALAIATFLALGSSSALAIGPQLQLDCGNWSYIKDGTNSNIKLFSMGQARKNLTVEYFKEPTRLRILSTHQEK